jgi:adenine-specific DNA-methyltransferase
MLKKGDIIFGKNESVQPQRKYLLKDNIYENLPSILFYGGSDDDFFRTNNLDFENPKPSGFSKQIIQSVTSDDTGDIILDFFAGSGTVGHAVLELNEETGGNRKFICVQLQEKTDESSEAFEKGFATIAEVTKARLRVIIDILIKSRSGRISFPNLQTLGFRKYALSYSNFKTWRGDVIENEEELKKQMSLFVTPQKANAQTENILWELMIKNGIPLTEKVQLLTFSDGATIYHTSNKKFAFILDKYTLEAQSKVLEIKPRIVICLDSLFHNEDKVKTNAQLKFEDNDISFKTV